MTAQQYLESVVNKLQAEMVEAIKKHKADDNTYNWGFKEGLQMAANIAFAHLKQLERQNEAGLEAWREMIKDIPGAYTPADAPLEGR